MDALKKTSFMILGSVLLFLLLAYVDEYENLFVKEPPAGVAAVYPYDIEQTLKEYARTLSRAYLDPAPILLSEIPASEKLRSDIAEEIDFLKKDGRVVAYDFQNLWMQDINQIAADKVRAETKEIIGVRYLSVSEGREIRSIPPAIFSMTYVLEHSKKRWIVVGYDVMDIKPLEDSGR